MNPILHERTVKRDLLRILLTPVQTSAKLLTSWSSSHIFASRGGRERRSVLVRNFTLEENKDRARQRVMKKSSIFGQFATGPNGSIEYKILTEDKIEDALRIQQKSMRQENIAMGVGIFEENGAAEAMKIVFREVIKDGCTIIAVDVNSDEVVGASFNKLHLPMVTDEVDPLVEIVKNHLKPRSSLALVNFLDDIESRVNLFERYGTKGAMEIFYVGTAPGYQGYKIGHGLVERSIELAKSFVNHDQHCQHIRKIVPGVVFGVFTSNYSQSIASKLNFEWLEIVRYEDYEYNGIKMSERIGIVHKTAKFGALKL